MKFLIVYGTTEGQTRKISEKLRDEAIDRGHDAALHDSTSNPPDPSGFDAVIVAASLHAEKYQSSVKAYIHDHVASLRDIPSAFVSVSLTAAVVEPESWRELEEITTVFLHDAGWSPAVVEQVAGALRYSEYSFFKKLLMRLIAAKAGGSTDTSRDHEYTDWHQVREIVQKLEAVGSRDDSRA